MFVLSEIIFSFFSLILLKTRYNVYKDWKVSAHDSMVSKNVNILPSIVFVVYVIKPVHRMATGSKWETRKNIQR